MLSGGFAFAQMKYDDGATDTEIKIGNIMPYSGPASAYGVIGRIEAAYFRKINDDPLLFYVDFRADRLCERDQVFLTRFVVRVYTINSTRIMGFRNRYLTNAYRVVVSKFQKFFLLWAVGCPRIRTLSPCRKNIRFT